MGYIYRSIDSNKDVICFMCFSKSNLKAFKNRKSSILKVQIYFGPIVSAYNEFKLQDILSLLENNLCGI